MLNQIIRYFDLQSESRAAVAEGQAGKTKHLPIIRQYLAFWAGIMVANWHISYIESGVWKYDISSFSEKMVIGLVIWSIIYPHFYKSSFNPKKPYTVQMASLFSMGFGLQSLFIVFYKMSQN